MMALRMWRTWLCAAMGAVSLVACGGGDSSEAPSITAQPQSRTIRMGESTQFAVTASGDTPLSYQWQRDGVDLADSTASSLEFTSLTMADNGSQWRVRATNAQGTVTSEAAALAVVPAQNGTISLLDTRYALEDKVDAQGRYLRLDNDRVALVAPDGTATTVVTKAAMDAADVGGVLAITMDAAGTLYIATRRGFACRASVCTWLGAIWKYGPDGKFVHWLGQTTDPSMPFREGIGLTASLGDLSHMRMHPNGDVYAVSGVSEQAVVFKVSPDAGVHMLAPGEYFAWDAAGNVYTAGHMRTSSVGWVVHKLAPSGTLTRLAGSESETGYRDGAGPQALFDGAWGGVYWPLAVDAQGRVYVAEMRQGDAQNSWQFSSIRRISTSGDVATMAGQRMNAGAAAGALPGTICRPFDMKFDAAGALLVGCAGDAGAPAALKIEFAN